MQIRELILKNYGKFHNRQIELEDGINLIYGENESGKSTIHTFIKGMLFGMERGRGRAANNDTYSTYEPWENSNYYAGVLQFSSGGKTFRIERNFDKYSKKAELICEEDGEVLSVEDGDLEMLLGGMDADCYDNTVSMSQRNAEMGAGIAAELKNYATNYYTSGNGEINLSGALEQLNNRKKVLEQEIRKDLQEKRQKREQLEQEVSFVWRDVHHLEEELETIEEELAYRTEKERKRRQEEESAKGFMDEIRPEKWRIHPMEILVFVLVIIIAVILFSKPWNYLIAIILFLASGTYIWNRMKVGKKQVKTEPEIILEEITPEEEKIPLEKLRWERAHIASELKEKQVAYENLGEQLAELDEVSVRSRECEIKRQAVQMAAEHLEALSEEMQGYLKRDLNEKASAILCEITDGKYQKIVADEQLHIAVLTREKRMELHQVSRGTVEQIYLALRMAVGELLCEEEMPVILDDTFAYYDENRMEQTLRWLKNHKKQVLLFTCQTREEQVLKKSGIIYQNNKRNTERRKDMDSIFTGFKQLFPWE